VLDLAHAKEVLRAIQSGEIEVITAETVVPSPVAASLLLRFHRQYMYEWDQPKAEQQMQALLLGRDLLGQLLDQASLPSCCGPRRCARWTTSCSGGRPGPGRARPTS